MPNGDKENENDKFEHHKLTALQKQDGHFEARLRYPGWRPDEVTEKEGADKAREAVYVQEFVGGRKDPKGDYRIPFQPPLTDDHGNAWILGGALNPKADSPFDQWLVAISTAARNYNASLYRLRRLHLIAEKNPLLMDPLPTDSPYPITDDDDLAAEAENAEEDWRKDVKVLREIIEKPKDDAIVDMVQVNGYIVSVRAVAALVFKDRLRMMQPAGSSSSHWSLSSAFSSFSG